MSESEELIEYRERFRRVEKERDEWKVRAERAERQRAVALAFIKAMDACVKHLEKCGFCREHTPEDACLKGEELSDEMMLAKNDLEDEIDPEV
ncbi:MAG: hypothetical protein ACRD1Z_20000 [Vicinamibacteria bacterium]